MPLSFSEGDWVEWQTWTTELQCNIMRGISLNPRYIVCVSHEHDDGDENNPYVDRWYRTTPDTMGLLYTGEGKNGNMTLLSRGNKALDEAIRNNTVIHVLRKKRNERKYLYCGIFKVISRRDESQRGNDDLMRNAIVFNLRPVNGTFSQKLLREFRENFNDAFAYND